MSPTFRRIRSTFVATMLIGISPTVLAQAAAPKAGALPATSTPQPAVAAPVPVDDPALKKNLETRLNATVDSISRLPLAGLYEVRVGGDIFYTDTTGNYIVVGNLIDLRTRENLTRTRADAIKQASLPVFKWADLPLDTAVKVVKGGGKRKVAIFEDPNCGYCKKLEKSILDIGDVTIYVFLYPVLGPDSLVKSKQVWCAPNRAKAWDDWMQNAVALSGDGSCATPLDKTLALGKKLKVEGTPTLFFTNDKRVEGAIDAAELERLLAAG
ncbi:MAG: DsbC family protein [Burkholderiaceae bacterium]